MRGMKFNAVQREFFDRPDRAMAQTAKQPNVHREVIAVRKAILADNPFLILEALDPAFAALSKELEPDGFNLREDLRSTIKSKRLMPFVEEWLDARAAYMKAARQRAAEISALILTIRQEQRTQCELKKLNEQGIPLTNKLGSSLTLQTLKAQLHAQGKQS